MTEKADRPSMQDYWNRLKDLQSRDVAPSLLVYRNVDVIDSWGYLSRNGTQLIKGREGFGWSHDNLRIMSEKYPESTAHDLPEIKGSDREIDVLLSFPGVYTFGHWPIDIIARIERALELFDIDQLGFIVPGPPPDYAKYFLDSYNIDRKALIALPNKRRYRSKALVVPYLRTSDYLPPDPFARSFSHLKSYGLGIADEDTGSGERLFVAHRPLTSIGQRATLSNADEIEEALSPLGFKCICPATMSIQQQVSAFSKAKVIVGEDSSSLHNIIYSSSAELIVINSKERKNLLHLSICKLLNHGCNYLFCEADGDRFACDPARIVALIAEVT